ncbi:MAG: TIGR03960 family B12-binding radical SAM protein [Nitrospinae bacterium]|nr:TIGR03960 family B12-binding radical SAM protein [Nitrospinota bacterium]
MISGKTAFERVLSRTRKPSSYLGTEKNSVRKDHAAVRASIAFAFPDLYDIGMSHLGLKILYDIVNKRPDFAAERVFAPDTDFAEAIKAEGLPLMSLETKTPLPQFDMIGFTIPYELSYTTILWTLDLAGIPLHAADRGEGHPLVIGGGAGVYNPEPIAEFFDLFYLGDGEDGIIQLMEAAADTKGAPRHERLKRMADIRGVYVPSLFDVSYEPEGGVNNITPLLAGHAMAERVFLPSLSQSPYPFDLVVPFGQPAHDRLNVEIDRGCVQGCRFCQAGTTYRPARERTPAEVERIVDEAIRRTGYGEVSLTSLSAGDHSRIGELLTALMDKYEGERVSVSLPSLRPATLTDEVIHQAGRVRRGGFTITAEAGSQRLRNVLNKKVTDDDVIRVASRLLAEGWRSLKLYFMIGLPTETDEDVEAIYTLASRLAVLNVEGARFMNINVSVSNFVPKAHTAFQWHGQDDIEMLQEKKKRLFEMIRRNRRITLKWHDARMSQIEAAFAKGDRRLSKVVETAYAEGARLDAWTEHFNHGRWLEAFRKCGLDVKFYANRQIGLDETLPWDHIATGLSKKYFQREWKLARQGVMTEDCKTGKCIGCGLDPDVCFKAYETAPLPAARPKAAAEVSGLRFKYRLKFKKVGLARHFSQLEFQNIIQRAARMAGLPMAYSQGHNPHPKISFGAALPVGLESEAEEMGIELAENMAPDAVARRLNGCMPDGIEFTAARFAMPGEKSISESAKGYVYLLRFGEGVTAEALRQRTEWFNASPSIEVEKAREKGVKRFDIKRLVEKLEPGDDTLSVTFTVNLAAGGSAQPRDVVHALFGESAVEWSGVKTGKLEG